MFSSKKLIALMTVIVLAAAPAAMAGVQLVAHGAVADATLNAGACQKVFLGKQGQWSDGTTIKLGILKDGPVVDEFYKTYVKKSPSQFKTFWKKAVFSGTGTAPKEFGSAADMVAWVAATPGAIGFVEDSAAVDGCKVITVQ